MAQRRSKVKSKSRARTKAKAAAPKKAGRKRKLAKSAKASPPKRTKRFSTTAFVGFDAAGSLKAVVLDETGKFAPDSDFSVVPATALHVEETKTGARVVVIDLSDRDLAPRSQAMSAGMFDLDKIRLQASDFARQTGDRASELGHRLAETTSELSKKVAGSATGQMAIETAVDLTRKAAAKASEIGSRMAETTSDLSRRVSESAMGRDTADTGTTTDNEKAGGGARKSGDTTSGTHRGPPPRSKT